MTLQSLGGIHLRKRRDIVLAIRAGQIVEMFRVSDSSTGNLGAKLARKICERGF